MLFINKIVFILLFAGMAIANTDIDMNNKMNIASNEDKLIMIFFHIPSCNYCETMLSENFKSQKILNELDKDFLLVDIYTKDQGIVRFKNFTGAHKEFSKSMKVPAYPATYYINKNGDVLYKSIGYRNVEEYYKEIKYISSKSYKKIDLETFIQELELKDDEW